MMCLALLLPLAILTNTAFAPPFDPVLLSFAYAGGPSWRAAALCALADVAAQAVGGRP